MTGAKNIRIGSYDCWTLADGELTYPGSALLPPEGDPAEQISTPYTALLIDTGATRILVDTGAGQLGPHTGNLLDSLGAAGFSPEDVHTVILSHAHPDHIAAVGKFPDAEVVMMRKEFEFWTADETQAKLASGEIYGLGPWSS